MVQNNPSLTAPVREIMARAAQAPHLAASLGINKEDAFKYLETAAQQEMIIKHGTRFVAGSFAAPIIASVVNGILNPITNALVKSWTEGRKSARELARIAAEKASLAQKLQGYSKLIGVAGFSLIGVIAAGAAGLSAREGAKGLSERWAAQGKAAAERWAAKGKAEAEVWKEAKIEENKMREVLTIVRPEDVANARLHKIIGQPDAVKKAQIIVDRLADYIAHPESYTERLERGKKLVIPTILSGPPGVGKTETIRAIAGELKAKGLDVDLIQLHCNKLFYGDLGPHAIGEMKKILKDSPRPSIVLLDEIDSLGSKADARKIDVNNAVMEWLDGFSTVKKATVVMGMTNYVDRLESAVRRRFPHTISFTMPSRSDLKKLFEQELETEKLSCPGLNMEAVLNSAEGFSGAHVKAAVELMEENLSAAQGHNFLGRFTLRDLLEANAIIKKSLEESK